jgi:hypothetical protein
MNTFSESTETKDIAVTVDVAVAIGETIRELGSVPSGQLYARLMGRMSIEDYEAAIGLLIRTRLVRREPSHLLVWAGSESKSNAVPDGANQRQR